MIGRCLAYAAEEKCRAAQQASRPAQRFENVQTEHVPLKPVWGWSRSELASGCRVHDRAPGSRHVCKPQTWLDREIAN